MMNARRERKPQWIGEHLSTDHDTRFVVTASRITVYVSGDWDEKLDGFKDKRVATYLRKQERRR